MAKKTEVHYATGRRKTASARIFMSPAKEEGTILVNKKDFTSYFPRQTAQMIIRQPLELTERLNKYDFNITVRGGGSSGQAGAVLHGISRLLQNVEPELRPVL